MRAASGTAGEDPSGPGSGRLDDRAPCGHLTTDPNGRLLDVNRTLEAMTGYARADLLDGRRFTDLLTVGGRLFHETHYAPMLALQGSVREVAFDLLRADGTRVPVIVTAVLERDDAGQAVLVRAALFDATERRGYERELVAARQRAEESEARARALARTLQQTLIPPVPPSVPGLEIGAVYRPAGDGAEVGGDFYDVFRTTADDWVVVLGDVCGKGTEAAVVTALARYTLRAACMESAAPSDALRVLNDVLRHDDTDRFATAVVLRLRRTTAGWVATVGSGGHPLPLRRTPGRAVTEVGRAGSLVGVLPDPVFHDVEVALDAGDSLLLTTDGVSEARAGREFYGEERLTEAFRRLAGGAQEVADDLLAEVLAYSSGVPRDDIAAVVVRVPD